MLPFKYLEDNRTCVRHLLSFWPHDAPSEKHLDKFRIASNAIYPFTYNGDVHLLRFAPLSEKSLKAVLAEIQWVDFLSLNGLKVPTFVRASKGDWAVSTTFDGTDYVATVMRHIGGKCLDALPLSKALLFKYGAALAEIHVHSRTLTVHLDRPDFRQILDFIRKEAGLPSQGVDALIHHLSALPKTPEHFGLTHYDYEVDNVFFDTATDCIGVIDFDDCHYHFYAVDVVKSLLNLADLSLLMPLDDAERTFLDGYASVAPIPALMCLHKPLFVEYIEAYRCARMAYALKTTVCRKEPWAKALKARFEGEIQRIRGRYTP